ncbi:unnamed protein product, partial [Nippostrongylus brasiliensis]|uniref:VWFA domain-containing protein n=1 Tax=Nippostrongylus brasiliensis TaxID=27835 RepID=A0A0N4XJX4_NIPBR
TDEHKRPIHPVLGSDGSPLPTDESGHPLGEDGKPIPTDASGVPLDRDGEPLPTDSSGNYVTVPKEAVSKELPTDESGNVIYPVTKPDGSPLPTDASGNFVTDEGVIIRKDDEGRPLGPDGEVLPTDGIGNFVFIPDDDSGFSELTDKVPLAEDGVSVAPDTLRCSPEESVTETLLFIVESSHQSAMYLDSIKALLKSFISSLPDDAMPKIGKLIYGATTEVTIDIGHYSDKDELVMSVDEIREIGGQPDANLALKIAEQLLMEESRGATVVLHLHVTPLSLRDRTLSDRMQKNNVKVVHLDEKNWSERDSSGLQDFICLSKAGQEVALTKPDGSPLPTDASGNFVTDEGTVVEKD